MTTPITAGGIDIPDATGLVWRRLVGAEGASSASAVPALFPVGLPSSVMRYFLPAGATTLTLAIMQAGILTGVNPANSTMQLNTIASMGIVIPSDGTYVPYFRVQRNGLGSIFVNPATGVTIVWNDLDPQYLAQYAPPVTLLYCGVDAVSGNDVWCGA